LAYQSIICVDAFNITKPPNIDIINQYGGFEITFPRLAMIDGDRDPWRPATAHASPFNLAVPNRTSTVSEPFILIENALHHYDENGLFPNQTIPGVLPPPPVAEAQEEEIKFVLEWMKEWERAQQTKRFTVLDYAAPW
jgi:hypothetical protein